MRAYAPRTELVTASGWHLRYLPGPLAAAMVKSGAAEAANSNGRVRSVRLVAAASTHARMIGPPTGDWGAPPFCVREKLDGGFLVWRHHPRCAYE